MITDYQTYWESCWKEEDSARLQTYLEGWKNYHGREEIMNLLKEYEIVEMWTNRRNEKIVILRK